MIGARAGTCALMQPNRPSQEAETSQTQPAPPPLDLPSRIEALLFVADEPAAIRELALALEVQESEVIHALEILATRYQAHGLRLQRDNDRAQLVTAPEASPDVQRFLGLDSTATLSRAALETLALVAYQQPVTRGLIESVRGVSCDSVLRTLVSRGLVAPKGRLDQVGRPIIYGTTFEFLQHFGLSHLSELPDWTELASSPEAALDEPGARIPGQAGVG